MPNHSKNAEEQVIEDVSSSLKQQARHTVTKGVTNTINPFHHSSEHKEQKIEKKYRKATTQLYREKEKIDKLSSKSFYGHSVVSESEKKSEKLNKKMERSTLKMEKLEDKEKQIKDKQRTYLQKRERLQNHLSEHTTKPFITTVAEKTSNAGGTFKRRINQQLAQEGDEGVQVANNMVSPVATKLRKSSVSTFHKHVGVGKKEHQLQKANKKVMKTEKKQATLVKRQRKQVQRKARANAKLVTPPLPMRIKTFFQVGKASVINIFTAMKMKLVYGGLAGLLSFTILWVAIVPLFSTFAVGGMGGDAYSDTGNNQVVEGEYNVESSHYQADNPYTSSGLRGQCTWFVWGRVHEVFGIYLPSKMGHGGQWISYAKNYPDMFLIGSEPKVGAIEVLEGATFGHVAFVESIDQEKGTMKISEGNVNNPKAGTDDMVSYANAHYKDLVRTIEVPITEKSRFGLKVVGYIYLDKLIEEKGK